MCLRCNLNTDEPRGPAGHLRLTREGIPGLLASIYYKFTSIRRVKYLR